MCAFEYSLRQQQLLLLDSLLGEATDYTQRGL